MNREYHIWYSNILNRKMELLVFGTTGTPVLFFPTRTARFYDYEDWHIIEALQPKIDAGQIQVFCVDSVDADSFYNVKLPPYERIKKHELFEQYILSDVIPFIKRYNVVNGITVAGCSLGAYHAVNIALRHPKLFGKVVGMSGRYDLTKQMKEFPDLFTGYWNETIYYNMPSQFIPNLTNAGIIEDIRRLEVILAIGKDDPFYQNNLELCHALWQKGALCTLHEWEGEAHKPAYWCKMVALYF